MDISSLFREGIILGFVLATIFTGNRLCKDVAILKSKVDKLENELVKLKVGSIDNTSTNNDTNVN